MEIFTIGFTKKRAIDFFGLLKKYGIKRLIDIRLHNSSQLAGFTRHEDLKFFLKEICGADYIHEPLLAPTEEMLKKYKNDNSWAEYEQEFADLLSQRKIEEKLRKDLFDIPTVLLCSEPTPEHCHRRLVADYLKDKWDDEIKITHL